MKILLPIFLFLILSATSFAQNHSGKYYRNNRINGKGGITIKENNKSKTFRFSLLAIGAKRGTCNGTFEGIAKWIGKNLAEFNGDFNQKDSSGENTSCRFTFVFSGKTITIRETNCNDYHGASCSFEGIYRRK